MDGERGLAWYTTAGSLHPVWLLVDDGRVVDCTPYAKKWAMGLRGGDILAQAEGATLRWVPLAELPTRVQWRLVEHQRLRRWRQQRIRLAPVDVTFAVTPDGGWLVGSTEEPHTWRFAVLDDTLAELRRRLSDGQWQRIPANYDDRHQPVADPELPDGLSDADFGE